MRMRTTVSSRAGLSAGGWAAAVACLVMISCAPVEKAANDPTGRAASEAVQKSAEMPQGCNPDSPCPGSTCATEIGPGSSTIPTTACPRNGEFQSDVDVYSWNTFVALNWPADTSTCQADSRKSIGDPGKRVWETYLRDTDVFAPGGPRGWCDPALAASEAPRELSHVSKIPLEGEPDFPRALEAFDHGPLVDRNGRWVRYAIHVNRDEYEYITSNDLYLKSGQQRLFQAGRSICFPCARDAAECQLQSGSFDCRNGCLDAEGAPVPCGDVGAIELKAAWKVLSASEEQGERFYTTRGVVFNDASGDPSPGENPVTLGLVGLHIVHKTDVNGGQFLWSTFEQVDNTTTSFFRADCPDCPEPNTQTVSKPYAEAQELDLTGRPLQQPAQVVRATPLSPEVESLNSYYQGLLRGTVWEHYRLVSTQWSAGAAPEGTPTYVANTTLETFFQKTPEHTCIACHGKFAASTYCLQKTDGETCLSADFSFLLSAAH